MSSSTSPATPTVALLADVFDLLDRHGYERAPGRVLCAALPTLDSLLGEITAVYEGQEVHGA